MSFKNWTGETFVYQTRAIWPMAARWWARRTLRRLLFGPKRSSGAWRGRERPAWDYHRRIVNDRKCFVVVAPGLERAAVKEARALGFRGLKEVAGGVEIQGGLEAGMRACLWLRCATTVRLRIGRFRASDRRALAQGLAEIQWQSWLPPDGRVPVSCTARKSRLHHTGMLAEAVARAAGRRLVKSSSGVHLRLHRDEAEISLDLAGERLHLRGWRKEGGPAPLRETLAAGILYLVGWRTEEPLIDPMCGSGTLPIEAALISARIAPGLNRRFAFESMPLFDASLWEALVDEARSATRPRQEGRIIGSDRHRGSVASSLRNAERAGVAELTNFERLDVSAVRPPSGSTAGVVVTNPPYGARIGGGRDEAMNVYRALGATIEERFEGWRCFVLAPDRRLAEATGLNVDEGLLLDNGGMGVRLFRLSV